LAANDPRGALLFARGDRARTALTADELCTLPWSFRFKADAGLAWRRRDAWWCGRPPASVHFKRDGTLVRNYGDGSDAEDWQGVTLRWRFARYGAGVYTFQAPARHGQLVRLQVDDRSVPTYHVSRHPDNWGWVMQSCWGFYTSWPMPPRGADTSLEDDAQMINVAVQHHEAHAFNAGLPLDEDDFAHDAWGQSIIAAAEGGAVAPEGAEARDWSVAPESAGADLDANADEIAVSYRRPDGGVTHHVLTRAAIRCLMSLFGLDIIAAKSRPDSHHDDESAEDGAYYSDESDE